MSSELMALAGLAGMAALASLAGGLLAAWRTPPEHVRGYLLHVAAGVLLAVISVELWPEIHDLDRPWMMIAGLAVGAVAMIGLNVLTHKLETRRGAGRSSLGLVVAAGIDSAVDGLLIGIGYAANPALGLLLAGGLSIEKFTMTMTVAAELRVGEHGRRAVTAASAGIAIVLVPAALAGMVLLTDPAPGKHALILSAAAAALVYLVVVELVARGRETNDAPGTIVAFFAGFVALASYAALAPG